MDSRLLVKKKVIQPLNFSEKNNGGTSKEKAKRFTKRIKNVFGHLIEIP